MVGKCESLFYALNDVCSGEYPVDAGGAIAEFDIKLIRSCAN